MIHIFKTYRKKLIVAQILFAHRLTGQEPGRLFPHGLTISRLIMRALNFITMQTRS